MTSPLRADGALLSQIAQRLGGTLHGKEDPRITGLHHDSRKIEPGDLFVARQGERSDGSQFITQAVEQGAVAVMTATMPPTEPAVPVLLVDNVRTVLGQAANVIYADPTSRLDVVGITGTNGKTTTSYLVRAAIDGAGGRSGVLGTLGAAFENLHFPASHTTPEADEVARVAFAMKNYGASHLVMEVSSHALDQRRADGVHFRVAAFTNLTQDHLDYHGTLQAYAAAKDRLFFDLDPRAAVVMIDDDHGAELAQRVARRNPNTIRVSTDAKGHADVRPEGAVHFHARGLRCRVRTPQGLFPLDAPYPGKHNLSNLLLTFGILSALDLSIERAAQALRTSPPVPGRLERCDDDLDDITVLVDYAHTPDALERALRTIRPLTQGRVLCAFGCGGDRDRSKRPLMGDVVGRLADVAVVTNDNPRTENPQSIVDAILQGMTHANAEVIVELDRALAIDKVVRLAHPHDVVLIAGKRPRAIPDHRRADSSLR